MVQCHNLSVWRWCGSGSHSAGTVLWTLIDLYTPRCTVLLIAQVQWARYTTCISYPYFLFLKALPSSKPITMEEHLYPLSIWNTLPHFILEATQWSRIVPRFSGWGEWGKRCAVLPTACMVQFLVCIAHLRPTRKHGWFTSETAGGNL